MHNVSHFMRHKCLYCVFPLLLVGATIIQAKDVQVKVGQDATITCIADGLPKPKVIWTVALGDSSSISSPTRSDIEPVAPVTKQFSIKDIVNSHEKKYTCLARNTIIKDGVKTRVIDTATIRLEVKGQSLMALLKTNVIVFLAFADNLID